MHDIASLHGSAGVIAVFALSAAFLPGILLPAAEAQLIDREPTLMIELVNKVPYVYQDEDGHTIALGEVINKNAHPITGVTILAGFYDGIHRAPVESGTFSTLLDVIPPGAKSPFIIRSNSSDPSINMVLTSPISFDSAGDKPQQLAIKSEEILSSDMLDFAGKIRNTGGILEHARVHTIFYDPFDPPQVVGIHTIDVRDIPLREYAAFDLSVDIPDTASSVAFMAESDNLLSNVLELPIERLESFSKKAVIRDVKFQDDSGVALEDVLAGSPAIITSAVKLQVLGPGSVSDEPYVYYAQVLSSGETPYVEYIGSFEGTLSSSGTAKPHVEWTPREAGLYYVETYIWTPEGVALASPGPISLVLVK